MLSTVSSHRSSCLWVSICVLIGTCTLTYNTHTHKLHSHKCTPSPIQKDTLTIYMPPGQRDQLSPRDPGAPFLRSQDIRLSSFIIAFQRWLSRVTRLLTLLILTLWNPRMAVTQVTWLSQVT